MIIQIDRPAAGNKWFNTAVAGGVSTCIIPANHAQGLNTLPNCVAAAWGCFAQAADSTKYLTYPPDAGQLWLNRAQLQGLTVDQTPAVGCVMVWGNADNINKGHVAFVYRVDADGTVYTSESEWNGRVWVNGKYSKPYRYGNKKFLGFIHQPKQEHTALTVGSTGTEVRQLQQLLISRGYMRKTECDGDFGKITKGAVLCYQIEHGLKVDGIVGSETWKSLEG